MKRASYFIIAVLFTFSFLCFVKNLQANSHEIRDLSLWMGNYNSMELFWTDPKSNDLYDHLAREQAPLTSEQIRDRKVMKYVALFSGAEVQQHSVIYNMKLGYRVKVDYQYQGPITDKKGRVWHLFRSINLTEENLQFSTLVLTEPEPNPLHFSFRYGDVSGQELVKDPVYCEWNSMLVDQQVTWEQIAQSRLVH